MNVRELRRRVGTTVGERFDDLMALLGRPSTDGGMQDGQHTLGVQDAKWLVATGVASVARPESSAKGWVTPFTVVWENDSGLRRRVVAWPRLKCEQDIYTAGLRLRHVSCYLDAVHAGVATCVDLKASFFHIELLPEARPLFGFRDDDGTVFELNPLPMGYVASPGIMQLLTMALAGHPGVVRAGFATPASVRVDFWVANVRFTGTATTCAPRKKCCCVQRLRHGSLSVTLTFSFRLIISPAFILTILKRQFPCHRRLSGNSAKRFNERLSVPDLEVFLSRAFFAAAVLGIGMIDFYFLLKLTRRRLSALNTGLLSLGDPALLSPATFALATTLFIRLLIILFW